MLQFDILTIFPKIFDSYFKETILARAQKNGLIKIKIHNLRDWAKDRHKTVDDAPYGGGAGMVVMTEPIYQAIKAISHKGRKGCKGRKGKVILLSPRGKKFNQKITKDFSRLNQIILVCGRYEGVDERVAEYIADEVISIGDYVLSGGELPAMVIIEAVSRLLPGVLGNQESLKDSDFPQYTRPAIFEPNKKKSWPVPKTLLSGNHQEIEKWRREQSKRIGKIQITEQ